MKNNMGINIKLENQENKTFNAGYKNKKRHSQNVLDQPDRLKLKAVSTGDKENFIPGTDIAVDSDDDDYIDVVTVDTETQNEIVNSTQCTDDDNNDNLLTLDFSHDVGGACTSEHTTESNCFDLSTPLDSINQSKTFLKTKDNSDIILKDAKVALERRSTIKILEYTTKSDTDKKHTNGNEGQHRDRNSFRAHYIKFCSQCNESLKNYVRKCSHCQKCKFLLQCLKCGQKYKDYNSLYYHLRRLCMPEPRLRCSKCRYSTVEKSDLISHIKRKHSVADHKEFLKCLKCAKSFKMIIYLKKHMKVCGTEPHLCCYHCSFKTKYRDSMLRHIRAHLTGKTKKPARKPRFTPVFCQECNIFRKDAKQSTLCPKCKTVLVFRCTECNVETASREALRLHETEKHQFEYKYQCSICDKEFAQPQNLKFHLRVCKRKLNLP